MARKARHLALLGAIAAIAAGCGSKDQGITGGGNVIGRTVTVYSIVPDPSGTQRDLVDGEKLALADAHGRAGGLSVNFSSLDAGGTSDELAAQAVRRAISDQQTMAVIADATRVTVPLLNAAGILQVAPAGDVALAQDPHANPSGLTTLVRAPGGGAPAGFDAHFRAELGRAPGPAAKQGYLAMRAIVAAVTRASPGNDRARVIRAFGATG